MGKTSIEWTDRTWNPITGCVEVSPGCDHCYAKTFAERWRGTPGHYFEQGFDLQLRPNKLDEPLHWKKPQRVFVNSMSDLFHKDIPDEYIVEVFAVMAAAPQHTFQVLTKRHARMRSLLSSEEFQGDLSYRMLDQHGVLDDPWPLPNVWLGVSAENQQWADIRIPALLGTPAAVRFVSAEPLLGPIDLNGSPGWRPTGQSGLDWVIVGGESGRGARPMHPDWARSIRDQCVSANVAFLFKQWGAWAPKGPDRSPDAWVSREGTNAVSEWVAGNGSYAMWRTDKKAAGRELDGRTWDEFPQAAVAL